MAGRGKPIGIGTGGKPLYEDDLKKMGIKDPMGPYKDPGGWRMKVQKLKDEEEKKKKKGKKKKSKLKKIRDVRNT